MKALCASEVVAEHRTLWAALVRITRATASKAFGDSRRRQGMDATKAALMLEAEAKEAARSSLGYPGPPPSLRDGHHTYRLDNHEE